MAVAGTRRRQRFAAKDCQHPPESSQISCDGTHFTVIRFALHFPQSGSGRFIRGKTRRCFPQWNRTKVSGARRLFIRPNTCDPIPTFCGRMNVPIQLPAAYDYGRDRRLRARFEEAAIRIGICQLDGQILEANPALSRRLGYTLQELAGTQAGALALEIGRPNQSLPVAGRYGLCLMPATVRSSNSPCPRARQRKKAPRNELRPHRRPRSFVANRLPLWSLAQCPQSFTNLYPLPSQVRSARPFFRKESEATDGEPNERTLRRRQS
jgi:PAS domain-containing protein